MRRKVRVAAFTAITAMACGTGTAMADGPGVGTPWVVTLGDSYISGEAGRWAGNTNNGESLHDALGSTAYADDATQPDCHRSRAAEAFIGGGVNGKNFACSGATTGSYTDGDGYFKPGLDFVDGGVGKRGQARLLQDFARTNNVKMVVVSIGGNDFNFGSIVQACVTNWATSPTWWKNYCSDDSDVTANFTSTNVAAQTAKIRQALTNVRTALTNAGSSTTTQVVVQDYMSPIPRGSGFRYSESGYTRQNTGGCGFWNRDADWANDTALPTINSAVRNAAAQAGVTRVIGLATAFNGRRLCETGVGLLEERGFATWTQSGWVNNAEWINQIRTVSTCCGSNYWIQESLHPNYWGQLALRNCVRQAYNGGTVRGGTCSRSGTGLNGRGEPNMLLG